MEPIELLHRAPVFADLKDADLEELAAIAESVELKRGQTIFDQDDAARAMYVLAEGAVGIRSRGEDGGDILVDTIQPGEVFGWSSMVEPYRYYFTARARDDGSALRFDREQLVALLDTRPDIGMAVYRGLTKVAADRLQETRHSLMTIQAPGTITQG